jgi:hypothetical protein
MMQTPFCPTDKGRLARNLAVTDALHAEGGAKCLLTLNCFATWPVFDAMRPGRGAFGRIIFNPVGQLDRFGNATAGIARGLRLDPRLSNSGFGPDAPVQVGDRIAIADAAGRALVKKTWCNGAKMPGIVIRETDGNPAVASVREKGATKGPGHFQTLARDAVDCRAAAARIRAAGAQIAINLGLGFANMRGLEACRETGAACIGTTIHADPGTINETPPWHGNCEWQRRDRCTASGVRVAPGIGCDPGAVNTRAATGRFPKAPAHRPLRASSRVTAAADQRRKPARA